MGDGVEHFGNWTQDFIDNNLAPTSAAIAAAQTNVAGHAISRALFYAGQISQENLTEELAKQNLIHDILDKLTDEADAINQQIGEQAFDLADLAYPPNKNWLI